MVLTNLSEAFRLEREELPPFALDMLDENGMSPLHYSISSGHADCVDHRVEVELID